MSPFAQRYSTAPNYPAQVVNVLLVASVIFSYMLIFGLKASVFQWWWALIKGICTHLPCFLIVVVLACFSPSVLNTNPTPPLFCFSHVRLEELLALVDRHQHQPDVALHLRRLLERCSTNGQLTTSSPLFVPTTPTQLYSYPDNLTRRAQVARERMTLSPGGWLVKQASKKQQVAVT